MKAMIGASAVAASLLVMVEPSGTGLEGVWAALAVLMAGRLATLGWRFQSADGPLPPMHLQQQQQLPVQQQQPHAQEDQQQQQHMEQAVQQDSSHVGDSSSGGSSSSSLAAAEVTAPLLLLNNSVEGSSSLRARRQQLGTPRTLSTDTDSSIRSRRLKKVHNGVLKQTHPPADAAARDAVQPVASRSFDGGHSGSQQ
jgi:hypothetical protein